MTAYDPQPTVTIGGIDYTSEVINSVTSTLGRTSVDEQPRPGYATIQIVLTDGTNPTIQLNDSGSISINTSLDGPTRVFTGYVTNVERTITAHGITGTITTVTVTMAGPLSRLARVQTAASYPKQFDGDRVLAILQDYEATDWTEVAPTLTWAAVNPAKTWETYDPGFVGTVDTPGSYELYAYAGGKTGVNTYLNQIADSALGVLWEDQNGLLNYSDAASRLTDVANNGFFAIPAEYIAAPGIRTGSSIGDLANSWTITYKNGATKTGSDLASIATYGKFDAAKTTLLESGTAAQQQLDHYLATRAYPRQILQAVTIPLHNPALSNSMRDGIIQSYMGKPVSFPDLPSSIIDGPFIGFIEGGTITVARKTAFLTLYVTEYALSQIEEAWQQIDSAEQWNTLSSILTWEKATVVA